MTTITYDEALKMYRCVSSYGYSYLHPDPKEAYDHVTDYELWFDRGCPRGQQTN